MSACPRCDATVSDAAIQLWTSKRPAPRLTIWCRNHKHRLAKVYMIDAVPYLCTPGVEFLPEVLGLRRKDGTTGPAHLHPGLSSFDELDDLELLRCACGIHQIDRGELHNVLNFSGDADYLARGVHYRRTDTGGQQRL